MAEMGPATGGDAAGCLLQDGQLVLKFVGCQQVIRIEKLDEITPRSAQTGIPSRRRAMICLVYDLNTPSLETHRHRPTPIPGTIVD